MNVFIHFLRLFHEIFWITVQKSIINILCMVIKSIPQALRFQLNQDLLTVLIILKKNRRFTYFDIVIY